MKLLVTPTVGGVVQKQFTTLRNPMTGRAANLSARDAMYWGNRIIQVNKDFCKGDPDKVTVKLEV